MRNLIRKFLYEHIDKEIVKEGMDSVVRRRVNFNNVEKILDKIKVVAFRKDEPPQNSILVTIERALYDIMPVGFEEDGTEYFRVWDSIKDYLKITYGESLKQYFEKRQRDLEEDKNPLGIRYLFVKHDKNYRADWRGFEEEFDSFDSMITKYGNLIDVNWDTIKQKLNDINDYPDPIKQGRHKSRPLMIFDVGDMGPDAGYKFSIVKQIPSKNKEKKG